ncbi:MAG TPA: WYL domain-containing protein, partial [Rhizomicrobium sp.]|nr:WYL domain-containing protein [Rhizomicrobium sp.]
LGIADIMATARLKLMAALPATVQPERIAARFHLDPAGWFRAADPLPSLQVVARAVWSEHVLTLRYRRAGEAGAEPRRLSPLGLVLKGGIWYLVAQGRKNIGTYRVANIHDAEITGEPFARPKNFDLAVYWQKASRAYETGVYCESADVRLSPRGVSLLELLGPHVTEAAAKSAGKPDRRGWIRCTLPLESFDFGVRELMRLGEDVEIVGPAALRAKTATTLSAMMARLK